MYFYFLYPPIYQEVIYNRKSGAVFNFNHKDLVNDIDGIKYDMIYSANENSIIGSVLPINIIEYSKDLSHVDIMKSNISDIIPLITPTDNPVIIFYRKTSHEEIQ